MRRTHSSETDKSMAPPKSSHTSYSHRQEGESLSTDIQSEHILDDVEECWSFQTALILVG